MNTVQTFNFQTPVQDYVNRDKLAIPKTGVLFTDFIRMVVERKKRRMADSYEKNYRTLIYRIEDFCREKNAVLYTESIGEAFLDDFIIYMEDQNLKASYIQVIFSLIKAMVRKAAFYGYAVDMSYDDVEVDSADIPAIYLTMNDIARIYYYSDLTRFQERIKDLFVIGCLTALRYSDFSTLTKDNIKDGFISKVTKKTGVRVVIPMHDFVQEIFAKYNGDIPCSVTSQHFNTYIKKICKKIGLTDEVTISYTRGGKTVTETKEKWQLISSHTCRRSGATNMMRTGRITVEDAMLLTGHSSEKSFRRYIKTTKDEGARQIAGDNFFRK